MGINEQGKTELILPTSKPKAKTAQPLVGLVTGEAFQHLGTEVQGYLRKTLYVEYLQQVTLSYSGARVPTETLRRIDHIRARYMEMKKRNAR